MLAITATKKLSLNAPIKIKNSPIKPLVPGKPNEAKANNMNNTEYKIEALKEPLKSKCTYPAYTFFIDYNGDVLTCSHDWGKDLTMGNLNKQSIFEIWTGKKFTLARKNLLNANRNFSPCNVCNVRGGLIVTKGSKSLKFSDLEQRGIADLNSIKKIANNGIGNMKGYKNKLNGDEDKVLAEWIILESKKGWKK